MHGIGRFIAGYHQVSGEDVRVQVWGAGRSNDSNSAEGGIEGSRLLPQQRPNTQV